MCWHYYCRKRNHTGAQWTFLKGTPSPSEDTSLPFIKSDKNHLARHSERGKKTRQTEEEVGRQHQEMDRPGVHQVPEDSGEQGKWRKLVVKSTVVPQWPLWLDDDDDETSYGCSLYFWILYATLTVVLFLLQLWASLVAATLVSSLPMKSRKRLAHDIHFCHTCWPCSWHHQYRLPNTEWQH